MHVSGLSGVADAATENIWNNIKTGLLKITEEVCGTNIAWLCLLYILLTTETWPDYAGCTYC